VAEYCQPVTIEQCCEGCEPAEPDVWAAAVEAAWTKLADLIGDPTLWEWRRCLRVWRPCPEPCGCRSYCDRCSARRVVTVPQFDVRPADVAGLIDGADINTAAHWTTRRDATSSELTLLGDETLGLPTLQNMDAPTGDPATWGVLLWVGRTPPAVREAVGAIACDILAACAGPSKRPPANATSDHRGGGHDPHRPVDPRSAGGPRRPRHDDRRGVRVRRAVGHVARRWPLGSSRRKHRS
jgi:hypothetical protein